MVRELWHVINTVHTSKWNIPANQVNLKLFFLLFFSPKVQSIVTICACHGTDRLTSEELNSANQDRHYITFSL